MYVSVVRLFLILFLIGFSSLGCVASKPAKKKSGGGEGPPGGEARRRDNDDEGDHGRDRAIQDFLDLDEQLRALDDLNKLKSNAGKNLASAGRTGRIPALPIPTPVPSLNPARPDVVRVRDGQVRRPAETVF